MPKTVLSYRFPVGGGAGDAYTTDNGEELDAIGRFVLPPDIDFVSAQAIINAIGAVPLVDKAVCSDSTLGKLRKLIFYRESGNTMSVAFSDIGNALTVAGTIRGLLNTTNNNVVCIKLEGEEFRNLNDRMQLNYTGSVATSHKAPSSAQKQNFLTGTINYASDVTGAGLRAIRSITEKSTNDPAAQIASEFNNCAGALQEIVGCANGRRNPLKHRRYILDFVTKLDPADAAENSEAESIEMPVASDTAASILQCGRNLAALSGVYCIGYKGESYSRVHRLLS